MRNLFANNLKYYYLIIMRFMAPNLFQFREELLSLTITHLEVLGKSVALIDVD